tara:strand:- start:14655 stop:14795 length:141 start_codon:yes stop_codon:yes gene_type:complete
MHLLKKPSVDASLIRKKQCLASGEGSTFCTVGEAVSFYKEIKKWTK